MASPSQTAWKAIRFKLHLFLIYNLSIYILANPKSTWRLWGHIFQHKVYVGVFLSPKLSPLKTNVGLLSNRIRVSWVTETGEPQSLWGFNIFSSIGRNGRAGFSAIKHLTKEELQLCRTPTRSKSGISVPFLEHWTVIWWSPVPPSL